MEKVLVRMPSLSTLYCSGNPFTAKIPDFRKTMIFKLKSLTFLNDRAVDHDERRTVNAFFEGSHQAESLELSKIYRERESIAHSS